jgi:phenylacetyl-CoA:acceptor oxidoreductase 26-kDa subunit
MKTQNVIKTGRQSNWDWRASGNFIGGGTGSGLLLFSAFVAGSDVAYLPLGLAALVLIGLGLFCVWLEIGRPFRAINVFRHAQTSWMTRESMVAPLLFGSGALAVWTGALPWIWLTAVLAVVFLYCQARMIQASKGIPAWRTPRIVPLFMVTGLTEGAGLLTLALALSGAVPQMSSMAGVLVLLLVARALVWRSYRNELKDAGTPERTLAVLNGIDLPLVKIGHWAAILLVALALVFPALGGAWLAGLAGLLALASGWLLKYTVIVHASFRQGYALARVPVRGAGALSTQLGVK